MQSTIQSILDAENEAKKLIQDAINKAREAEEKEASDQKIKLEELEVTLKDEYEKSSDEFKLEMRNEYANSIKGYNQDAEKIAGISIDSEVDELMDVFLNSF